MTLSTTFKNELKEMFGDEVQYEIKQDEQDQLRQEYVDMEKKVIPKREELIDARRSLNDGGYAQVAEFNDSQKVGGGEYEHILFMILDQWQALKIKIGNIVMKVNSGFRNPYRHNTVLKSKTKESSHLYGKAIDVGLRDFNKDGKVDEKDRLIISVPAKSLGACIEPEEKTPTWIHLDWRGLCPTGW